jgi:hypothetical protein
MKTENYTKKDGKPGIRYFLKTSAKCIIFYGSRRIGYEF